MSELRWALLLIGLFILAGIYFYHKWRAHTEVRNIFNHEEPSNKDLLLDDDILDEEAALYVDKPEHTGFVSTIEIDSANELEMRKEPDLFSSTAELPEQLSLKEDALLEKTSTSLLPEKPSLMVMHIVADKDKPFAGEAVIKALQAHKLRFGEHQIFHRILEENGNKQTVYSVASMVKPGTLDPDELRNEILPGLTLILNLPAPIESLKAYDDMLHVAQHMTATLEGSLVDEAFMTLSREKIALDRAKLF